MKSAQEKLYMKENTSYGNTLIRRNFEKAVVDLGKIPGTIWDKAPDEVFGTVFTTTSD